MIDIPGKVQERQIVIVNRNTKGTVELSSGRTLREGAFLDPGLALSPNGCILAHQADWRLEIYRICGCGSPNYHPR